MIMSNVQLAVGNAQIAQGSETVMIQAGELRGMMQALDESRQVIRVMADMVRTTNERMTALENEIRVLVKITPAQVTVINREIRDRAAALAAGYRMPGREKDLAAAIRKMLREQVGISVIRDVPRCEYDTCIERIRMWEDWKEIKRIRGLRNT